MVEHFDHEKISSDHRSISSISLEKIFEQNRAFFERNQAFFERDRAETPTSGKCNNQFENLCLHFEQKYQKQIYFTFLHPKK